MNQPTFRQFPFAYRFSQGGIALAIFVAFSGRIAFQQNMPNIVKAIAGCMIGCIVISSLVASYYVIIRYPFLSLVEAADGDKFSEHFSLANGRFYFLLKILAIVTVMILAITLPLAGLDSPNRIIAFIYAIVELFFLIYFAFWYCPIRHPTIATFIRSTLGIGVALFPLYIPAIYFGSRHCNRLLDDKLPDDKLPGDKLLGD